MQKILLLLLLFAATLTGRAQSADPALEAPVRAFFQGFSTKSADAVAAAVAPGFVLLEDGAVFTIDSLLRQFVQMQALPFTRTNHLTFLGSGQKGDAAWIYYDNVAYFKINGQTQRMRWLESAVLVRTGTGWKIRMLHSSKVQEPVRDQP